jgi:3-hydroxyacyl-[acyl-carrier-protein] dehydratase
MRWYWIDRFIEFESGRRAKAIKAISLAEDHLHDHFPGYPVMPNALVIEGVAQTGGLLVCEHGDFTEKVVLAKIAKAVFFDVALPGDVLTYTADVDYIKKDGAMVTGTVHRDGALFAKMELVFAHLNTGHEDRILFEPTTFLTMMRMLGAFEIGHAADGGPLVEPARLTES